MGGAEALGPNQDVLQPDIRIGNGSRVVTQGVHKRCRQLTHGLVEFREGPRDVARSKGGVDVLYHFCSELRSIR